LQIDVAKESGKADLRTLREERARTVRRLDPHEIAPCGRRRRPRERECVARAVDCTRRRCCYSNAVRYRRLGREDFARGREYREVIGCVPLERAAGQLEAIDP